MQRAAKLYLRAAVFSRGRRFVNDLPRYELDRLALGGDPEKVV